MEKVNGKSDLILKNLEPLLTSTKVNIIMIKNTDMVCFNGPQVTSIKETTKTMRDKDMEK
jgi:hypothetical protein